METNKYYQQDKQTVISYFETDEQTGLSSQQVSLRQERDGKNKLDEGKKRHIILKFFDQFKDFMVLILLGAALLSFLSEPGHLAEPLLILSIVLINALLGLFQEARAERALESIKAMSSPHATVLRDGKESVISVDEVVVGDIIILQAGDYIPADVRILKSINLKTDESALTGEAVPVEKSDGTLPKGDIALGDRINLGFMSTVVTYGRGSAVVTHIGMQTEIGKIATMLTNTVQEETPLQKNIHQLGKTLALIALAIVTVIFLIQIVEGYLVYGEANWTEALLQSVALAVAAIPEGLPAIITIVLALGMQNLVKRRAIMRRLPAVETLGSTSIICSDKTGTLTQNVMTVTETYLYQSQESVADIKDKTTSLSNLIDYGVLCNDTKVQKQDNKYLKIGDPTEIALVDLAIVTKENPIDIIKNYPRIHELPFDSERKLMTTVHKIGSKVISITKGAPDVIFKRTKSLDYKNQLTPFTDDHLKTFEQANQNMADRALRVLAVSYKIFDASIDVEALSYDELEQDLVLLGLVGMIDPARPEVKDAIAQCKTAGITTIMITGDHKNTAVAIAKDLGILNGDSLAITGHELDQMNDQEFKDKLSQIRVFARVSPENKVRIVTAWKETGLVVAMTGDGVNDAPSISKADIGIAMGITGTEVAKGAADMILTDDNFATIVGAVSEGRAIFSNIKKAIHFLLSCNIGEIITILLGTTLGLLIFSGSVTTLTAAQILWVNLVTDSLMAIALGLEPKEPNIMNQPPRDTSKSIFSGGLGMRIAWQGLLLGLLSFGAYTAGFFIGQARGIDAGLAGDILFNASTQHAQTLTFMVLSISQLIHAFNVRSDLFSTFKLKINKFLIFAFILCLGLQLLTVAFPFTREIFSIDALTHPVDWLIIIGLSLTPLILVETIKFFLRRKQTNQLS